MQPCRFRNFARRQYRAGSGYTNSKVCRRGKSIARLAFATAGMGANAGQLAWYKAMEEAGEMRMIKDVSGLNQHIEQWIQRAGPAPHNP